MNRVVLSVLISILGASPVWAGHAEGHVDVDVGVLSPRAAEGQQIFNQKCGSCHGVDGAGTLKGPPLIHAIYNPGHHGNGAFSRAVTQGVRQHHWPYGDMPAQPDVGFSDMAPIVSFIREVQEHNGIVKKAHKM
ncbi:MAG: mono/diheme cytochrome c family protein [Motiliproteus sp.]|jgi:mono/diheme cytochrome c family protein